MPITRRRRAINPPEQTEQTNLTAERTEPVVDTVAADVDKVAETSQTPEPQVPATPARREYSTPATLVAAQPPVSPGLNNEREHSAPPVTAPPRSERRPDRYDFGPNIESGRRTARGELFRRPPQVPPSPPQGAPVVSPVPLQPPSHEISLPLGNLLHLAYNPGYTGSDEARSTLLQQLSDESKAGGRARCWSCGSLAIVYDRWNTGSKNFGEVGVAFCEICGVWSVM